MATIVPAETHPVGWADTMVNNVGMSESPSVVFDGNNKLYCFHQGTGNDGTMWYSVLTNGAWQKDVQVPNTQMSNSPSAIIINGVIIVYYHGPDNNGELWQNMLTTDGKWQGPERIRSDCITGSPSAVAPQTEIGSVGIFYQGYNSDGTLRCTPIDNETGEIGFEWVVEGVGLVGSPNAVQCGNNLFLLYQGRGANGTGAGTLWYSKSNNNGYDPSKQVPNVGISSTPGGLFARNYLWVFHQGGNNVNELWYCCYDPSSDTWHQDTMVTNVGVTNGPSAAVVGQSIYCFHQGGHYDGTLWYFGM